jgi:hypothetical protein
MITNALTNATAPFDTLIQLAGGAVVPRSLHVIADLGVADVLGDAPQSATALAAATGVQADALDRTLRLLSAYGIFERLDGLYAHTPASRLLRTDHPQSMRSLVRMLGLSAFWNCWGELEYSVRTGLAVTDKVLPGGLWGYLSSHPNEARIFDEAMTGKAHGQVAGVLRAYNFKTFNLIGDIGGGRGHLLQAVLSQAPQARGVLFDQPHVIEAASGVATDRLALQAGDFFKDPLPSCDAYLLMEVIHDWDDERAKAILRAVRSAASRESKILIIEAIVSEDSQPSWPKMLDIWMLGLAGKQRTQREYAALLNAVGLQFTREIDTGAGVSIIEAVPDWAG